tara:strand:+ start:117 stop:821 length:705 start_codon:yes stop_codon:yes gene_type:complete
MHRKGGGKSTRLVLPGTINVGFAPQEIIAFNGYTLNGRMPVKKVGRLAWQAGRYASWHQPANWTSEQKVLGVVLSKSRAFYTVAIARNRVGVVGVLEVHGGLSNIHRGQVVYVQVVALPSSSSHACRVSLAVPQKDSQPGTSEQRIFTAMTHGYLLGLLSRDNFQPIRSLAKLIKETNVDKPLERDGISVDECEYAAGANHFVWVRSPRKRTMIDVLGRFARCMANGRSAVRPQ